MRSTFTSGAWVEHTPVQELKGKHRRNMTRAGRPQPVFRDGEFDREATISGTDVLGFTAARRDAVWAMVITGWSYDLPLPVFDPETGEVADVDSFGDLPLDDLDELEALMDPIEAKLNRKPDPKAQAAGITSSSNGSSRESAAALPPTG